MIGTKTPSDYGAEYSGFVQGFLRGMGTLAHPIGDEGDRASILRAATLAWEDHLIRVRRAESREAREPKG